MINVDDRFLTEANEDELYLVLHVAKHMDKDNFCFPSVDTLSHAMNWSSRKTRRIKIQCIEKGFFEIVERYEKNGGRKSDGYKIKTDRVSIYVNLKDKGDAPLTKHTGGGDKTYSTPLDILYSTPLTDRAGEVLTNEVLTNEVLTSLKGLVGSTTVKSFSKSNFSLPAEKLVLLIEFLQHRKNIKKQYRSAGGITAVANQMAAHSVAEIRAALDATIQNEWQGLFIKKLNRNAQQKPTNGFLVDHETLCESYAELVAEGYE